MKNTLLYFTAATALALLSLLTCYAFNISHSKDEAFRTWYAGLDNYVYQGEIGGKSVMVNIYQNAETRQAFYGSYSYGENPDKVTYLQGSHTLVRHPASGHRMFTLNHYHSSTKSVYMELFPKDNSYTHLFGHYYDSVSTSQLAITLVLQEIVSDSFPKLFRTEKFPYTRTLHYTGNVGKLPVEVLLHTDSHQVRFMGNYFYPTYQADKNYGLKGGVGFAVCGSRGNVGGPEDLDGNLVSIEEYDLLRRTASLSFCKPDGTVSLNSIKGRMYNHDGKSFLLNLNLKSE